MQTLFSHIVQKRLSRENEDIATESFAFLLSEKRELRLGFTEFLRNLVSELPELHFRSQLMQGGDRPDLWGFAEESPRIFVESKFWAGLTEQQPVSYLRRLASHSSQSALVFLCPESRVRTLWRELMRRLKAEGVSCGFLEGETGFHQAAFTSLGPKLAILSWGRLLKIFDQMAGEDEEVRENLNQLRSLCDVSDDQLPLSTFDLTDQRIPKLVLQLGVISQEVIELGFSENIIVKGKLTPQANWERAGRYVLWPQKKECGIWIGVNLACWNEFGESPLWCVFYPGDYGRANEAKSILEPWGLRNEVFTATREDGCFVVPLVIKGNLEKEAVVRDLVEQLRAIAFQLWP